MIYVMSDIHGCYEEYLEALRMIDFKDNLPISFKFAVKCYLEDMKNDGIAFLVEMACVGFCFAVAISGLLTAIPLL